MRTNKKRAQDNWNKITAGLEIMDRDNKLNEKAGNLYLALGRIRRQTEYLEALDIVDWKDDMVGLAALVDSVAHAIDALAEKAMQENEI